MSWNPFLATGSPDAVGMERMGLNPTILRPVRAFALAVSPSEPPAVPRRGYRASGFVLTSIPAVCGQRAKPSCRPELRTMRSWRPEIVAIQICVGSSAA